MFSPERFRVEQDNNKSRFEYPLAFHILNSAFDSVWRGIEASGAEIENDEMDGSQVLQLLTVPELKVNELILRIYQDWERESVFRSIDGVCDNGRTFYIGWGFERGKFRFCAFLKDDQGDPVRDNDGQMNVSDMEYAGYLLNRLSQIYPKPQFFE